MLLLRYGDVDCNISFCCKLFKQQEIIKNTISNHENIC